MRTSLDTSFDHHAKSVGRFANAAFTIWLVFWAALIVGGLWVLGKITDTDLNGAMVVITVLATLLLIVGNAAIALFAKQLRDF